MGYGLLPIAAKGGRESFTTEVHVNYKKQKGGEKFSVLNGLRCHTIRPGT